ncbi:UNVERIFIED_CONTAM: hypothetical protein GTU68_038625 [Idotea baltica]|nr:hypothetical protein [Idotea baltica]
MPKKRVTIGLLGAKLDQPKKRGDRWSGWRPSVTLCQQPDLIVDRLELLYERKFKKLAQQVTTDIEAVSPETEVRLHEIPFRDPWDFEEVYASLYQFARDYKFNTDAEDYLIHITTGSHVAQICLFLLTESRHLPGVLIQTSPRRRDDHEVFGSHRVIDLDLSRYDHLASRFQVEHQEARSFLKSGIETRNDNFNALIDRIEQVAPATDAPILLTGPTGAGKSQLAKRIFQLKKQRGQLAGQLVEVNCATIRGDQSMSTLFGHVKGAFTGAMAARPGLLKVADQGLLFLDEIGELGRDEQAMLLRAIEEKSFMPVGSDASLKSDFQLIAGTNRDLLIEVQEGRFREDLLARINLWMFRLPGLADRRDDIEPNLEYELQQFAKVSGRKVTMNKESQTKFLAFASDPSTPWKANFRDLNAAVTRMATLSPGGRITSECVDEEIERLKQGWRGTPSMAFPEQALASVMSPEAIDQLDQFDQMQLGHVIELCRRSKSLSAAGRKLFQVSRQAKKKPNDADRLRKYLAKFGLSWTDLCGDDET